MFKKSKCFLINMGDELMSNLWLVFFCFKMSSIIFDIIKLTFFYFPNEIIKNSSLWWLRMAAGGGTRLALMCTLRCCDCVHAGRHYQSHYIEIRQFIIYYARSLVHLSKRTTKQASDVPSIIFFFIISCKILCKNCSKLFYYFLKIKNIKFWVP